MEEHLLLRVPDELKERLNSIMQSTGGADEAGRFPLPSIKRSGHLLIFISLVDMSYECISTNGRDFVFSIEGMFRVVFS